ncbi:MAG: outer membrane protein assembly factor BamD [Bacteroidia bacterium]|nr:outer membrane protein assembly factor BamD [Bacteroidia bacterium]
MKKLLYLLLIIVLGSCSEYQKVLKSESLQEKFEMGTELYDAEKYPKANRLFMDLVPKYRGKPQAEKLMYMYSKTFYYMKDYYTANYQMERFVSSYPKSEKKEELAFLGAKSYYNISPAYSKDQKETIEAIDKMQAFINQYPSSEYLEEANAIVKELDFKLEKKAYDIAKQYNTISDYQASIKAFDNFLLDYPGSQLREQAHFYRFDAAYQLAINSVEWKKEQRINKAISYFNTFKRYFPESKFLEEASSIETELNELLKQYQIKS